MTQVREILAAKNKRAIESVKPETPIFEALQLMATQDISAVLVLDAEGHLAGIFTERDYARKVALAGRNSRDMAVREAMTRNLLTVSPTQTVDDVMELMTHNRIRHLPVVERGELIGIITIGDAVKTVIDEQQTTIRQLSGYIAGDLAPGS